jgi:hypothetical protein
MPINDQARAAPTRVNNRKPAQHYEFISCTVLSIRADFGSANGT